MIDLSKLSAEGLRLEGQEQLLPLEGRDGLRDLRWSLYLMPSGTDVFMDVRGSGIWECFCSRCLEPFEQPIDLSSQFLGSSDGDLVAKGSRHLGSQDLDVVYIPETELDEMAIIREQFLLQLPMHPLCKEECLGLCSRCGKNWNKGRCNCSPEMEKEPSALAKALSGLKLNF